LKNNFLNHNILPDVGGIDGIVLGDNTGGDDGMADLSSLTATK
jgi:hypothetical protein